ncbi:MAG TPA: hypothetical protein VFE08_03765 [Candidatus Sulfotelmatobacter sp.]|jgi:hypothetical protein|nr:hypothetical protein [Terriglobales bacterium]HZZ15058.1 hypothetical protein [Candidatus Sulfotelmatobacter sp.]
MRSDLVFRANDKVANRFELCRLASSSARTMVRNSVGMHLTINQALEAISEQSAATIPAEALQVDEVSALAPVLDPAV